MSELGEPLEVLTLKIQSVEEKLQQTSTAIREINAELKRVGGDHFAQQVSYNLLKGLGDGLIQAAESGKPEIDTSHADGQPQSVQ